MLRCIVAPCRGSAIVLGMVLTVGGLPGSASGQTFSQTFENGSLNGTVLCGGWAMAPGFDGGQAVRSTTGNSNLELSGFSGRFGHYHYDVYLPANFVADGDLEWLRSGSQYYWLHLAAAGTDNEEDAVMRCSGTSRGYLGCAPKNLTQGNWHAIDIYMFPNGVIQVFMDNAMSTPRITGYDPSPLGAGTIVLRAHQYDVRFDNVSFDPTLPAPPPIPSAQNCFHYGPEICLSPSDPPPPSGGGTDGTTTDDPGFMLPQKKGVARNAGVSSDAHSLDAYRPVPNPFHDGTRMAYVVGASGAPVNIRVYDVAGRLVRTLVDGFQRAGRHVATWDGQGEQGSRMTNGVYFVHVRIGNEARQVRVTFLR